MFTTHKMPLYSSEIITLREKINRSRDVCTNAKADAIQNANTKHARMYACAAKVAKDILRSLEEELASKLCALSVDAGCTSVDAGRASVDAGRASEEAGRVSEEAGRASEEAGRVSEEAGRVSEEAGCASEEAGRVSEDADDASEDADNASEDADNASEDKDSELLPNKLVEFINFLLDRPWTQEFANFLKILLSRNSSHIKSELGQISFTLSIKARRLPMIVATINQQFAIWRVLSIIYANVTDPELHELIDRLQDEFDTALNTSIEEGRNRANNQTLYKRECRGKYECHGNQCFFSHWERPFDFDSACESVLQLIHSKDFSVDSVQKSSYDQPASNSVAKKTDPYDMRRVPYTY